MLDKIMKVFDNLTTILLITFIFIILGIIIIFDGTIKSNNKKTLNDIDRIEISTIYEDYADQLVKENKIEPAKDFYIESIAYCKSNVSVYYKLKKLKVKNVPLNQIQLYLNNEKINKNIDNFIKEYWKTKR